jgi:23S rRNA (adenine2503-C2)-methyltransferase
MKANLFGQGRDELLSLLSSLGEPAYRAAQIYKWLYARRVRQVAAMTDLAKPLREKLAFTHDARWPDVVQRTLSYDGTVKFLFRLEDGATIESVYIPEDKRRTICISTQAGCPLKCGFCLTGVAGYKRNLKPAEILGQVATVMEDAPPREMGWNVVVMGMGEKASRSRPRSSRSRPWASCPRSRSSFGSPCAPTSPSASTRRTRSCAGSSCRSKTSTPSRR